MFLVARVEPADELLQRCLREESIFRRIAAALEPIAASDDELGVRERERVAGRGLGWRARIRRNASASPDEAARKRVFARFRCISRLGREGECFDETGLIVFGRHDDTSRSMCPLSAKTGQRFRQAKMSRDRRRVGSIPSRGRARPARAPSSLLDAECDCTEPCER